MSRPDLVSHYSRLRARLCISCADSRLNYGQSSFSSDILHNFTVATYSAYTESPQPHPETGPWDVERNQYAESFICVLVGVRLPQDPFVPLECLL
jgi:hypothetical protein